MQQTCISPTVSILRFLEFQSQTNKIYHETVTKYWADHNIEQHSEPLEHISDEELLEHLKKLDQDAANRLFDQIYEH